MPIVNLCQNLECGAETSGKYCKYCDTPVKRKAAHEENVQIRQAAGLPV